MNQTRKLNFILMGVIFSVPCFSQTTPSICPVEGLGVNDISMRFGIIGRVDSTTVKPHNGVDFAVEPGTPVRATADGIVVQARTGNHYGLYVKIRHSGGYETLYAHLSVVAVKKGQEVKQGERIGFSGQSGLTSGPVLHYEVRRDGKHVDPAEILAK